MRLESAAAILAAVTAMSVDSRSHNSPRPRPTAKESLDALEDAIGRAHGVGPITVPRGRDAAQTTFTGWKCEVTKLLCADPRLPAIIVRVGVRLVMFANQFTYSAYPKYATLAATASVSVGTVKKACKVLQDLGYISRKQRRGGGSNEYFLQRDLRLVSQLAAMGDG